MTFSTTTQINLPSENCHMLRSPSKESVTTDLSLFSVSTEETANPPARMTSASSSSSLRVSFKAYSEAQLNRAPSPNPENRSNHLSVPSSHHHMLSPAAAADNQEIPEIWFEEDTTDLILSCAALSNALGLRKSFSTSDISHLPPGQEQLSSMLKPSVSEVWGGRADAVALHQQHPRLDHASRSCSLWVAVGDVMSSSQLPSPQGRPQSLPSAGSAANPVSVGAGGTTSQVQSDGPSFTAADLIRSVNKKVRQNYIRRRLLTTYRALERLSQSEFNLDRLEIPASSLLAAGIRHHQHGASNKLLQVNNTSTSSAATATSTDQQTKSTSAKGTMSSSIPAANAMQALPVTLRDVERDRGKPLSKYERNMIIFNWLHSLDDGDEAATPPSAAVTTVPTTTTFDLLVN